LEEVLRWNDDAVVAIGGVRAFEQRSTSGGLLDFLLVGGVEVRDERVDRRPTPPAGMPGKKDRTNSEASERYWLPGAAMQEPRSGSAWWRG
jgi:hypothetical protein